VPTPAANHDGLKRLCKRAISEDDSLSAPAPTGRVEGTISVTITVPVPDPPGGWRRTPPVQESGTAIMLLYGLELSELARNRPAFRTGCTVAADYEQRDGEWFPVPASVRVTR
jgi:hypothetical protein